MKGNEKQSWATSPSNAAYHFGTSGISVAVATGITHPLGKIMTPVITGEKKRMIFPGLQITIFVGFHWLIFLSCLFLELTFSILKLFGRWRMLIG